MLYTVELGFAIQQRKSVMIVHIHISPPLEPVPSSHATLQAITELQAGAARVAQQASRSCVCFTHGSVFMPMLPSQFIPPSPLPASADQC